MGRSARPGRRLSPLSNPGTPLGNFAQAMRDLRDQAGDPSYEALARESGRLGTPYSETSLRNAASGRARPSWGVVEAYVRACAAFAEAQPRRASGTALDWHLPALLDTWAARWREISLSADRAEPGPAPGPEPRADRAADPLKFPGNLPSALAGFIGRERELAEGARLVLTTRLVTLTGVGGVGKTSLALRVAEETASRFPAGVWLVELAGLTERAMVDHAVATVVGVQLNADERPLEAIAKALRGRQVLLVLDNCEHLLDVTAALAQTLLRAVPSLHILTTSRQPLNVAGEHVLEVGPFPPPGDTGTDSVAVDLFADRARAVSPGFRVTAENRATVAAVCRLLDGLPLALELAARRLRTLSLDDLLDRLDRRFLLLGPTGAERTAHPRHRTLRGVFDWSYDLCSPDEQLMWQRLSVSAGNVSLADAEVACTDERLGLHAAFEAISGLVDKSLLRRTEPGGRTRLHMLETVRLYGQERLVASGREPHARRLHLDHYLGLARHAEEAYATPGQQAWLERLGEEHANLRQAFTHALAEEQASSVLFEGAYALWMYWIARGKVGEAVHWMRRITGLHPEPPDDGLASAWCRTLWSAAFVLLLHGDGDGAEGLLNRVEPVIRNESEGLHDIRAAVHQLRGLSRLFIGDIDSSQEQSWAALRTAGHRAGMLTGQQALAQLGLAASIQGAHEEAAGFFQQALELSESCGEIWHRSYLFWTLAMEHAQIGRSEEAVALLRRSLELKRRLGDRLGVATVSETLASVLAELGEPRPAAQLLGAAHSVWQPAGAPQLWGFSALVHSRDRSIGRIRQLLGEKAFRQEYAAGERLGLTHALDTLVEHRP
ncbi:tetratricopeptide repeat protein [Nonomuraea sp. NPDC049758]|uniref:ATP-binding protein n=1 Tax=Nonomuraea sp. NPDC049758 TaxID=3154360 RepID=UPI003444736B